MAKGLLVRFYMDAVHLSHRSEAEGRPIFEDREHVEIIPIGDNKTAIVREATPADKQRFADEYAAFKRGAAEAFTGTPLRAWPAMMPAMIKMLEYHNCHTVEHLAALDDMAISRLGIGMREWVEKAKAFLLTAAGSAEASRFAAENERMRAEMAAQAATIADMAAKLDALSERRGPGRPPKPAEAA